MTPRFIEDIRSGVLEQMIDVVVEGRHEPYESEVDRWHSLPTHDIEVRWDGSDFTVEVWPNDESQEPVTSRYPRVVAAILAELPTWAEARESAEEGGEPMTWSEYYRYRYL